MCVARASTDDHRSISQQAQSGEGLRISYPVLTMDRLHVVYKATRVSQAVCASESKVYENLKLRSCNRYLLQLCDG